MAIKQRIDSVQSMRAIAALLVVLFHSGREAVKRAGDSGAGPMIAFFETCDFGVDLFFVISGFIMYYVTYGRDDGPAQARDFLMKRLVRVAPMYWLFVTLFILPLLLAPQLLNRTGYSLPYLISSYLFVPWQRPGAAVPSLTPIFGVGWTLNYEILFYAVFALLIGLRVRSKLLWLAIIFGLTSAIGPFVDPHQAQAFFWTRSSTLEFVMGVALAALFCRGRSIGTGTGLALIGAGIALWQWSAWAMPIHSLTLNTRGVLWGLAAAAIATSLVLAPRIAAFAAGRDGGPMQMLGNASFSLYLSHLFVIRITSIVLGKLHLLGAPLLLAAVNVVAASLAALLVYRFVEKPLLHGVTRLVWRRPRVLLAEERPAAP